MTIREEEHRRRRAGNGKDQKADDQGPLSP
jgi:hypothetical protein